MSDFAWMTDSSGVLQNCKLRFSFGLTIHYKLCRLLRGPRGAGDASRRPILPTVNANTKWSSFLRPWLLRYVVVNASVSSRLGGSHRLGSEHTKASILYRWLCESGQEMYILVFKILSSCQHRACGDSRRSQLSLSLQFACQNSSYYSILYYCTTVARSQL